jgi:TrmH family RNA methyltransferase
VFYNPYRDRHSSRNSCLLKSKTSILYAATLQTSERYDHMDFTAPAAIAVGMKLQDYHKHCGDAATANIIFPMVAWIDSTSYP